MPETTASPFGAASPVGGTGLADAVERERRRLAQELHDTLAQELVGISLMARALERTLQGGPNPSVLSLAAEIARAAQAAAEIVRDVARGLAPVVTGAGGLTPALTALAERTERRYGIPCNFQGDASRVVCDGAAANHLFRIAQEAITNAVKHAAARHIAVSLDARPGGLRLRVRDDGIGIRDSDRGPSLGLGIMHERATLINAALVVEAADGGGTAVTCTVPAASSESLSQKPPSPLSTGERGASETDAEAR